MFYIDNSFTIYQFLWEIVETQKHTYWRFSPNIIYCYHLNIWNRSIYLITVFYWICKGLICPPCTRFKKQIAVAHIRCFIRTARQYHLLWSFCVYWKPIEFFVSFLLELTRVLLLFLLNYVDFFRPTFPCTRNLFYLLTWF